MYASGSTRTATCEVCEGIGSAPHGGACKPCDSTGAVVASHIGEVSTAEREAAYGAFRALSKSPKNGPWPECGIDAALASAAAVREAQSKW